jgi:hypothetical protein
MPFEVVCRVDFLNRIYDNAGPGDGEQCITINIDAGYDGGNMSLLIPVSWGELLDKITILQIKSERMTDTVKRGNVRHELNLLVIVRDRQGPCPDGLEELVAALRTVNEQLWDIEDAIRLCEKKQDFGAAFIELARAVYTSNDRRAALKYRINSLLGSQVIEEKSYESYGAGS